MVVAADAKAVRVARSRGQTIEIVGDGLKLVAPWLSDKAPANRRLKRAR